MGNAEVVARAIVRTLLGFRWHRMIPGGPFSYLSNLDQAHFKKIACDRGHNINCIAKSDAIAIGFELRQTRILRAIHIFSALNCSRLLQRLACVYHHQEADSSTIANSLPAICGGTLKIKHRTPRETRTAGQSSTRTETQKPTEMETETRIETQTQIRTPAETKLKHLQERILRHQTGTETQTATTTGTATGTQTPTET
jgi:hypothetical protein